MTGISVADANAAYLVKKVVCAEYGITLEEMALKTRSLRIAFPRQVAMWLCHRLYNWGERQICAAFNKGRGTPWNALKTVGDRMDTEDDVKDRIEGLIERIRQLAVKLSPIFGNDRLAERVMKFMEL